MSGERMTENICLEIMCSKFINFRWKIPNAKPNVETDIIAIHDGHLLFWSNTQSLSIFSLLFYYGSYFNSCPEIFRHTFVPLRRHFSFTRVFLLHWSKWNTIFFSHSTPTWSVAFFLFIFLSFLLQP